MNSTPKPLPTYRRTSSKQRRSLLFGSCAGGCLVGLSETGNANHNTYEPMTKITQKEAHVRSTRNELIRGSIKEQIWQKGDWEVDIVMDALGLEPDTAFGKAMEAFIKKHGAMIEEPVRDEVFHEKREAAIEEREEQRLLTSHQPTISN